MTIENLKKIMKAVRLPLFSNRPDVRLFNNRLWPPITPKSWAGDAVKLNRLLKM